MVRPHLQNRGLMSLLQAQQRQRHADVIVETGLAPKGRQLLAQHCRNQILGRGFSIGTAHRHDPARRAESIAVRRRQPTQGATCVIHEDHGAIRQVDRSAVTLDHDGRGAFARDFVQEAVPIKLVAFDGKEQVARLRLARVRAYPPGRCLRRTAQQFADARRDNKS